MFKAESTGEAVFRIGQDEAEETKNTALDYQLHITQHIPLEEQKATPEKRQSPTLQFLSERLKRSDPSSRQKLIHRFWEKRRQEGTPLIEAGSAEGYRLVTFLWRGAEQNVTLWGAPSGDHEPLQRLPDTDIWFKTFELPDNTLLSYRFAPDVPVLPLDKLQQRRALLSTLQSDPLNPHDYPAVGRQHSDKFNYSSVLRLENAPRQPFVKDGHTMDGKVVSYQFHSRLLNNLRRVRIYFPPGWENGRREALLLFIFDGKEYTTQVNTPQILDLMISRKKLPATVAVFIDNISVQSRRQELPPNPLFAQMMAEELYPWVLRQTRIISGPDRTALIGSSYGGLAAAYIAGQYPHIFGNVLAMSGSFWWKKPDTPDSEKNYSASLYAERPLRPIRFFISAGLFEADNRGYDILNSSRHLKDVLKAKGYSITYREYAAGHDYLSWQGILSEGLSALFERSK